MILKLFSLRNLHLNGLPVNVGLGGNRLYFALPQVVFSRFIDSSHQIIVQIDRSLLLLENLSLILNMRLDSVEVGGCDL